MQWYLRGTLLSSEKFSEVFALRVFTLKPFPAYRGNEGIYLHRSDPLLDNGLDRPESRYGRYELRVFLAFPYSCLALWVVVVVVVVVVVDMLQFLALVLWNAGQLLAQKQEIRTSGVQKSLFHHF